QTSRLADHAVDQIRVGHQPQNRKDARSYTSSRRALHRRRGDRMTATMRRREFITVLGGVAAWPLAARAQLPAKRPLIAMLVSGSADGYSANVRAFRRGLQELGYTEGRDLEIAYRYADGDPARMPALAAELVKLKPDVIVTTSTSAAQAAK